MIFEMNACCSRFNHRFHQLISVQRAAKASFRISNNRREPIRARFLAFCGFNLVRAKQRAIDALYQIRCGVARIETLVGINVARRISIRGHLPSASINRFQPRLHHFNRLIPRDGAKRGNVRVCVHQIPEPLCSQPRQRVLDLDRAAQPQHI